MSAVPHATDGIFCDTATLTVSNGQVWDGLFCDVDIPVTRPQPPQWRSPYDLFDQALREDEELIMICQAFIEVLRCR